MSGFVLDCSVAVAWCIDDEAAPATDALLPLATKDEALRQAATCNGVGLLPG